MNSIFFNNKSRWIVLISVALLFSLIYLTYLYFNAQNQHQELIKDQVNKQRLIASIELIKLSQKLEGLDQQRSVSVFENEYSLILKEYQHIALVLEASENKNYINQVEMIITRLHQFKETANVRNDYSYRRNNLRVIIENAIDLNAKNEQLYIWNLLKSAVESRNLLSLGEFYRHFIQVFELIDHQGDAESKKIKNIAFGSLNVFSTMENIISMNVVLSQNLEEIASLTQALTDDIALSASKKAKVNDLSDDVIYFKLALFIIFAAAAYLIAYSIYSLKRNKTIFSHIKQSADLIGLDKQWRVDKGVSEKALLLHTKISPYIYSENNASYLILNKEGVPCYVSSLFYQHNKSVLDQTQQLFNQSRLVCHIQDNHFFLTKGDKQHNQVLEVEVLDHLLDVEISQTYHLPFAGYTLLFTKSEVHEKDKQNERLDSLASITGAVAHDINNMISVIVSSLSILRDSKSLSVNDDAKVIDRALFSADKSINLIDRLLTFSRCKKLNPELIEINELLEGLYEVIGFATDEKVKINFDLTDKPLYTYLDAGQLETSIINLCINSSNAMPKGGEINISTQLNAMDRVSICVADNGHGIPKNLQGKVFEPFFTGRKKGEGHGLGLSMVYGFVKQSGGDILLESKVGQGTQVSISFSLKRI